MSANKTKPTAVAVDDFIDALPDARRQREARTLVEMMGRISGDEPVMWGPSIIGFGTHHYRYESGREGDTGIIGFSPRKAQMTIYFLDGFEPYAEQLSVLGKHSLGKSCLYIKKLDDVDLSVLETMVSRSFEANQQKTDDE